MRLDIETYKMGSDVLRDDIKGVLCHIACGLAPLYMDILILQQRKLNLRAGPGTVYKKVGTAKKGTLLFPSGKTYYLGKLWFHCSAGWFSGSYEEGWIQEENNRWWYLQNGGVWPKSEVMKIGDQEYAFDSQGWMITADRIAPDGHITE